MDFDSRFAIAIFSSLCPQIFFLVESTFTAFVDTAGALEIPNDKHSHPSLYRFQFFVCHWLYEDPILCWDFTFMHGRTHFYSTVHLLMFLCKKVLLACFYYLVFLEVLAYTVFVYTKICFPDSTLSKTMKMDAVWVHVFNRWTWRNWHFCGLNFINQSMSFGAGPCHQAFFHVFTGHSRQLSADGGPVGNLMG